MEDWLRLEWAKRNDTHTIQIEWIILNADEETDDERIENGSGKSRKMDCNWEKLPSFPNDTDILYGFYLG